MELSQFDKENVGAILQGHGDWFSAQLLRLIARADWDNRAKIALVYPDHFKAWETWFNTDHDAQWDDRPVNGEREHNEETENA